MRPTTLPATLAVACLVAAGTLVVGGSRLDEPVDRSSAPPVAASPTPVVEPEPPAPTEITSERAPPPPPDRADVEADLRALLADPALHTGAERAVVVLDEWGRPVVELNPQVGLLPASTMKLVTAAAVLELHGPADRLHTEVLLDGDLTDGGTLLGDVVLRAGGDPALTTAAYRSFVHPSRPSSDIADAVAVLRVAGVERITGDVVADPGSWADAPVPPGWRDRYLSDFDGRSITGLTIDAGLEVEVAWPRARWTQLTDEQVDDVLTIEQAGDPLAVTARALHRELRAAGLPVDGTARAGTAGPAATAVGSIPSPLVADLVQFMVKRSDNHLADTLFRAVGAGVNGRSDWARSATAVKVLLSDLKVDFSGAVFADGSGLSRLDRLTARLLAQLDLAMTNSPDGDAWASHQAVAGRDGTLRGRLRGTIAQGRFRGKTGTLDDVRALAGAVAGPDGGRYHLAVIGNGGQMSLVNALADAVVLRLTRSLWCDRPTTPADLVAACAELAATDVTGPHAPGAPAPSDSPEDPSPDASEDAGA